MAKSAKSDAEGSSAVRSNGYDPEAVKGFASRVENLEAEIEVFRQEFEDAAKPIKEDITGVIAEAEAAGIPKMEFKKVLKHRRLERKVAAEIAKLTEYEQGRYDNLRLALGDLKDTPLGAAALSKTNGAAAHA